MTSTTRPVTRNTVNLLFDTVVFVGFLAATAPNFTGLAIHEWLSLAVAAAIITHLLLHWNWIVGVTRRFFGKATWGSRVNYLLNGLLFVAFTTVIFTGVMISEAALPLFGIRFERETLWMQLHRLASDASVLLIGLHVALHWRWIVNMTRRLFRRRTSQHTARPTEMAAPVSGEVAR
ncbi:MAG: DUF4405 domain-containing protein [Oscillochloris sp.]|nr:DUF4405 domain-containing protein [Oscillochloris sp.]